MKSPDEDLSQDTQQERIINKAGGFVMVQIIMGHGVSWCFGTRLAPIALTCGLRISDNPTSDNLTPQETTNQDAPDMGPDGAGLSCPGSSVVADKPDHEGEDS